MKDWFSPKMDEAIEIMDEVTMMIEELEETENIETNTERKAAEAKDKEEKKKIDLNVAEKQVKNDKDAVESRMKNLTELEDKEAGDGEINEEADAEKAVLLLNEVELALADQIESWNKLKAMTDDDKLQAIFQEETRLKNLVAENRKKAHTFINKYKPKSNDSAPPTSRAESLDEKTQMIMKVKKMDPPTFNGDSRAYARFKKDFKEIMLPTLPNETQRIFTLKMNV